MSGEPTQRNIFFFLFCVNLLSRESTQRIAIFLTSCHVSPTANRDFFFLFFVFKILCYMCKSLITWVHRAHHDFLTSCQVSPHSATFFSFLCVNLISRESTQRITILQISRYTSPRSASQFTNDRWGWSKPSASCQIYNLSIRKPIQWIRITIKEMFWTYKKQERKRNFDPAIIYRETKKNYGIW